MRELNALPASAAKAAGLFDRCFPLEHTLALVPLLRERYGITRIADATHLDRSGIPTYSAIVPESPDLLSVYNGKGTTAAAAICSAVMEAVERQVAAAPELPAFAMRVSDVQKRLDVETLALRPGMRETVTPCVMGTNMLDGAAVPVPLALVQCPWFGDRLFKVTSTNGLASGNNLTEAIYHALCELIERHTWSMYHARSHLLPQTFFGPAAADIGLGREVLFPTGDAVVDALASDIRGAGLELRVLYLEEAPLPPTMVATIVETRSQIPMSHMGFGTSLSPSHAIARALTEAIQSRVVDIQAAREDIVRADAPKSIMCDHARRADRLPAGRWYFDVPAETTGLQSIADFSSDDLACDLARILEQLRAMGADAVVMVDLSPAALPVHVVRVVVPHLESTIVDGRIGPNIRNLLNPFRISA